MNSTLGSVVPLAMFYIYVWYILLHSTRVHVSPKFSHKNPRIYVPQSQRLASGSLPPSQWCSSPSPSPCSASAAWGLCQDPDLLPLDTNMLAAATHDIQSKFEVLFTERQSQSCIQNQLNMMRNGLDWNLMEIPFHSDSDWRESWSTCSPPESSAVDHLLCQNVARQTFVEHVICGTTCAFLEQAIHVLHIIRPAWNIQHTPDLMWTD